MKSILSSSLIMAFVALLIGNLSFASGAATDTKPRKIPFHGKLQSVDSGANTVTLEGKKAVRVFHVTPETKITDGAGNPTTLGSGVAGEDVGGSYTKEASGEMMLNSLRLGAKTGAKEASPLPATEAPETAAPASSAATPAPKPAPAPAVAPAASAASPAMAPVPAANTTSTKAKKERFTGTVVSVDAGAGTMVVHGKADQTFTVTSSTKITGAQGLGSIAAGAKVSGSYEKSADGATMTVTTLKVK